MPSHHGHGFALGHADFQLPPRSTSRVARGRVRSSTPERLRGPGGRHGSSEHGTTTRDRERNRDRGQRFNQAWAGSRGVPMTTVRGPEGDPVQQARAYRATPAGPQEAE